MTFNLQRKKNSIFQHYIIDHRNDDMNIQVDSTTSILKSSYWSVRLFVCLFVILCVRPRKKNFFWRLTYLILILKPVSKHKEYICILFVQMN